MVNISLYISKFNASSWWCLLLVLIGGQAPKLGKLIDDHVEGLPVWWPCSLVGVCVDQVCIFRLTCSHPELTEDHVLTSAYIKIFRTVTRNAVNKSVWRKKDCYWLPLNKHAMNIWLSSLRIRAHLSWRTGKHLHVLHVLRTYSTCSYPGY